MQDLLSGKMNLGGAQISTDSMRLKGAESVSNNSKSMHEMLMQSFNKQQEIAGLAYEPPQMIKAESNEEGSQSQDTSQADSQDPAISIMESDPGDISITMKPPKKEESKKSSFKLRNNQKNQEPAVVMVPANRQSQMGKSQDNSHHTNTNTFSNSYSNAAGVLDTDTQQIQEIAK